MATRVSQVINEATVMAAIRQSTIRYNATVPPSQRLDLDLSTTLSRTSAGFGSVPSTVNGGFQRGNPIIEGIISNSINSLAPAALSVLSNTPGTTALKTTILGKDIANIFYDNVGNTTTSPSTGGGGGGGPSTVTTLSHRTVTSTRRVASTSYVQTARFNDEISSTSTETVIPWIREATTTYKVKGIKPNVKYNGFIDNKLINQYITPATELSVSSIIGNFDCKISVANEDEDIRKIENNVITALNRGDVITGSTSGATAVLMDFELAPSDTLLLSVVNVKGTFTLTENITGSYSGATAVLDSISIPTEVKSTPYGNFSGLLTIPNTDLIRFPVGTVDILFTTEGLDNLFVDSWVGSIYTATGTLTTIQPRVTNIRTFVSTPVTTYTMVTTSSVVPQTVVIPATVVVPSPVVSNPNPVPPRPVTPVQPTVVVPVTNTTIVEALYRQILDREAEPAGKAFWVAALDNGTLNASNIGQQIYNSATGTSDKRNATTTNGLIARLNIPSITCRNVTDPLCQSFYVEESSGVCVTGIDLFFAKIDPNIPINVAIINMENGYPGQLSYPLSEVMVYPSEINVSSEYHTLPDGKQVKKPTPTRITFKAPVYLEGNSKGYGIYIKSDSIEYEVWTSYMGEGDVDGKGVIATQPLLGSLFKSQNSRTWTTDQYEDLNFTLYKAEFYIHAPGSVPFINSDIPPVHLKNYRCAEIVSGSSLIRFVMFNHGLSNGDTIQISGLDSGTYGGTIPETNINGTFTVTNVEFNTFVIETGVVASENATLSQKTGLYITENIKADYITPAFKEFIPGLTDIRYKIKPHNKLEYTLIKNKISTHLDSTLSIYNPIGEVAQLPSGEKSIEMNVRLESTNFNISPMLFIDGTNILTGNNIINKPDVDNYSTSLDMNNLTFPPTNSGSTLESKIETSTTGLFDQMVIGNVVILYDGTTATTAGHIGEYVITDVQDNYIIIDGLITIPSNMYITFSTRYLDEITPLGSSSVSKYVSKQLKFSNISKGFKTIFTYNKPSNTFIDLYYRISDSRSEGIIHSDLKYTKIDSINFLDCEKLSYRESEVTINNIDDFDTINIKIVFNADDSNNVPSLKDFRLIAVI